MTTLYPSLGSSELQPYEAPLGRMMLAYGRAIAAVIALVTVIVGNEAKAGALVDAAGMKELPKRVRKIAKGKLSRQVFDELSTSLTNLKEIAGKRNQLIHGEWWFNVFKDGRLTIRGVRAARRVRRSNISALFHLTASINGPNSLMKLPIVSMALNQLSGRV